MTRNIYGVGRNLWYDPGDESEMAVEWDLTIRLYHALQKGYQPLRHRSFPGVTLLVRKDGDMRAVMGDGHHRLAILSHFGRRKVTVRLPSNCISVVREQEIDQWYYVKRKQCTREHALEIFDAFFELNGRERIGYLGLPSVY
jgi:hypothetical protein